MGWAVAVKVVELSRDNAAEHVHALEGFESGFSYPLGASERFTIRHGADYGRFFRAIGNSACFIALEQDRVIGAISVALRPLLLPDGRLTQVAYLGDLKVLPSARGGPVMYRLVQRAASWAQVRSERAFAVVMDGTRPTPDGYTGRAGLPRLERLASVCVIRLPLTTQHDRETPEPHPDLAANAMTYQALSMGRYATPAHAPQLRSRMALQPLLSADGSACGLLVVSSLSP